MKVTGGLRFKFCPDCGDMHDVRDWPDNHRQPHEAVSCPAVHADGMSDLWHPHDGQIYDSKSAFRQTTKASGGEEVGNEVQKDNRVWDSVTRDEVAKAAAMVSQGYKPNVQSETLTN